MSNEKQKILKLQSNLFCIGIFAYLTAQNCIDQFYQLNMHRNYFPTVKTDEKSSNVSALSTTAIVLGFALILALGMTLRASLEQTNTKSYKLMMLSWFRNTSIDQL